MIRKIVLASICTACVLSATPGMAASRQMPEGQRDTKAMDYTKHRMMMQKKENKEANSNVDRMIKNRR